MSASALDTSLTLLDRLGAGDQDAWRHMVTLYTPLLRGWLRHAALQPADVEDLTQNALAVVLRKLPAYRHNGHRGAFRTWLRRIIDNVLRESLRGRARRAAGGADLLAQLEDPASELNRRWDAEHDRHVLRGLLDLIRGEFAEPTWQAFARTTLDGLPAAQVAADLGMSVNAVHIARSRFLARLRREAEAFLGAF
jgi:RNA polymerase sigma-70 factor (ECF subfamily)